MIHWGVANQTYHGAWQSHRSLNDSVNSVENIFAAVNEFQQRSVHDESVLFILTSNIWDSRRYLDNFFSKWTFSAFIDEFSLNYGAVVRGLKKKIRAKDILLLQTTHLTSWPLLLTPMAHVNNIIRKTAMSLSVPLFDEAKLLEPYCFHYKDNEPGYGCTREHLQDPIHQNMNSDHLIVTALSYFLRQVPYEHIFWSPGDDNITVLDGCCPGG